MFDVLLESKHVRPPRSIGATMASAILHGGLVLGLIGSGTAIIAPDVVTPMWEQIARLILPPDRAAQVGDTPVAYSGAAVLASPKGELKGVPVEAVEKPPTSTSEAVTPLQTSEAAAAPGIAALIEAAQAVGAFSIVDVDSAAERDPLSAAPAYPRELLTKSVEGYATMRFVVDSTGLIDLGTIKVLDSTHPAFTQAVRDAMPRMRFRPAKNGGNPVRQLAEQQFKFEIRKPPNTARAPNPER
ncbi:MAG: TonB family protein [Gemmatimonadetes bacterium]|nr:TonB family protein [Gemmatimonadota bacterium]